MLRKRLCICIDVYKIYESDDIEKVTVCFRRLKKKKLNIENELDEKYKTDEDFEEKHFPGTAEDIYRVGHDSIRLLKSRAYYDRY